MILFVFLIELYAKPAQEFGLAAITKVKVPEAAEAHVYCRPG